MGKVTALAIVALLLVGCPPTFERSEPPYFVQGEVMYTGTLQSNDDPVADKRVYIGDDWASSRDDGSWTLRAQGRGQQVDVVRQGANIYSFLDCETHHDLAWDDRVSLSFGVAMLELQVSGVSSPEALRIRAVSGTWNTHEYDVGPEQLTDLGGGEVRVEMELYTTDRLVLVALDLEDGTLARWATYDAGAVGADDVVAVDLPLSSSGLVESTFDGAAPDGVERIEVHQDLDLGEDVTVTLPVFDRAAEPATVRTLGVGSDEVAVTAHWPSSPDCPLPSSGLMVTPSGAWGLPELAPVPGIGPTDGTWSPSPDLAVVLPTSAESATATLSHYGNYGAVFRWQTSLVPGCGDRLRWPNELRDIDPEYGGEAVVEAVFADGTSSCRAPIELSSR
jgi:hypothetical protein